MRDYDGVEILLVEDNEHDAAMTIRALNKSNLANKLFWVKDGVEALEYLRCQGAYESRDPEQVPKLVLLDLKMPRLDGLDVLKALKSDESTANIPVVAMTSSTQGRDLSESYRLGVNGYVTKPVQFASFAETVAKIGMYWLCVNQDPVVRP